MKLMLMCTVFTAIISFDIAAAQEKVQDTFPIVLADSSSVPSTPVAAHCIAAFRETPESRCFESFDAYLDHVLETKETEFALYKRNSDQLLEAWQQKRTEYRSALALIEPELHPLEDETINDYTTRICAAKDSVVDLFKRDFQHMPSILKRYLMPTQIALKLRDPNEPYPNSEFRPLDYAYRYHDLDFMLALLDNKANPALIKQIGLLGLMSSMLRSADKKSIEVLQRIDLLSEVPAYDEHDEDGSQQEFCGVIVSMLTDLVSAAHQQPAELVESKASYIMAYVTTYAPDFKKKLACNKPLRPTDLSSSGARALNDYLNKSCSAEKGCYFL